MQYVDLSTMEVCTRSFLTQVKRPGLIVKNFAGYPLTAGDLTRLDAAPLDESATGDRRTGKAIKVDGVYCREYRPFTADELAQQAQAALAATDAEMPRVVEDLIDTLIGLGVMAEADLPQVTRDRLADKRNKRAAL